MEKHVYSGQMNSRVEFFEEMTIKASTGEPIPSKNSLGFKMVKRIDGLGNEEEDGRLLAISLCRFQMRFDSALFVKASTLIVTDFDGDWQVFGPARLLDGRRRYMELKCRKRGEN